MNASQLINEFRAKETLIACAVVIDDFELEFMARRFVRAWLTLPRPEFEELDADLPEDENARWDMLWLGYMPNISVLSERSGLTQAQCVKIFAIVRANRLIYPDHTAHGPLMAVLDLAARQTYEARMSKGKKPGRRSDDGKQKGSGDGSSRNFRRGRRSA